MGAAMSGPGHTEIVFVWGQDQLLSELFGSIWRLLAPRGWEASGLYGPGNHVVISEGVGRLPLSQDGFVKTDVSPCGSARPCSPEAYTHTYHLPVEHLKGHAVLSNEGSHRIGMSLRHSGTDICFHFGPSHDFEVGCPAYSKSQDITYLLRGSFGLSFRPWGTTEAVLEKTLEAYDMFKHLCDELKMSECYGSFETCQPPDWMWGREFQFGNKHPNRLIIPFEERRMPTAEECADRRLDGTAIWHRILPAGSFTCGFGVTTRTI